MGVAWTWFYVYPRAIGVGSREKGDISLPAWYLPTDHLFLTLDSSVLGVCRTLLPQQVWLVTGCHMIHRMPHRYRFWLWKYIYICVCICSQNIKNNSVCFKELLIKYDFVYFLIFFFSYFSCSYIFSYFSLATSNIQINNHIYSILISFAYIMREGTMFWISEKYHDCILLIVK